MHTYDHYKEARNAAWRTLIGCGVSSLPVNLSAVLQRRGIRVIPYSRAPRISSGISEDGYTFLLNGSLVIALNEKRGTQERRRFTIAHELGHILLNHPLEKTYNPLSEGDAIDNPLELEANVFARDLLAPAIVLHALKATTADEIMRLCNISRQSAEIRAQRLAALDGRGAFGRHPWERQVYIQFKDWIETQQGK